MLENNPSRTEKAISVAATGNPMWAKYRDTPTAFMKVDLPAILAPVRNSILVSFDSVMELPTALLTAGLRRASAPRVVWGGGRGLGSPPSLARAEVPKVKKQYSSFRHRLDCSRPFRGLQ